MRVREIGSPAELQAVMQAAFPVSDQQWQAVSAPLEPAVVIAGAGSGKTTLMAARVVYLVVTGQVRPDEVLGLTFTTKAASELRRKIRDALVAAGALGDLRPARDRDDEPDGLAEEQLEPTVLTYNAYAAQLLTEHGLRIGHEPDTRVVTDAARYQLGARVVDRFTGDVHHLTDHPPTAIQNLLALDGAMSEHLATLDDVRSFDQRERAAFLRAVAEEEAGKNRKTYREPPEKAVFAIDRRGELLQLVADYRRLKADLGLMDFSDQIELGARLAAERSEVGVVERGKFRVVLLDEYQDTSVAQATMLSRLFSGPDPATGQGHAVTAVGDPNQAIYGWRGASVSNIVNFAETFPPVAGEPALFHLTVSRRSDRRILDAANHLAAPLYAAYDQVEALRPADGAAPGEVRVAVHETAADELDALVASVTEVHTGEAGGLWSDIAVLTRDNSHAEGAFDALTAAGIPVEIVGLKGLLRLPEVAEVVATLQLLHDVTHNPSMLTLLTGPRWAVGPRDLRLLSRRAVEVSGRQGAGGPDGSLADQLVEIADGVDPAELPALDDALADPGEGAYSAEALDRFALLAGELRYLRAHVGEPLLDLVRRIMDASGVDVELASAVSPAAAARRDNLDLFVKAVADFQAVDGDVTLPALLAYLTAEDDQGNGLDLATPSEADSVKLLTVHRAKGLEWASVFLVGVCETRFPSNRSRVLWTSSPSVLPAPLRGDADDLPQLAGHDKAALDDYRKATRAHDAEEELRLGYVAVTRPAHLLSVSSYCWGPRTTPYGPSAYQATLRELLERWGEEATPWRDKPVKGDPHPYADDDPSVPWPTTVASDEARLRLDAAARVAAADPFSDDADLDMLTAARIGDWDDEIERLLTEARRDRGDVVDVPMPSSLSATAVARLRDDAEGFARDLARPMPRPPSPAARFGTRFHAWVEARFGQLTLLDTDEISGRGDSDVADDVELHELIEAFEKGDFADRVPLAVEPAFALVLDGQVVRGRIDAVYREPDGPDGTPSVLVVDWKTSRNQAADPLQLAIYRLAWAELHDLPLEQVRAGFYYVRSGELVEPADLPDRASLEQVVRP
ncbi:ATP-dependent DNA helicase [Nocardioides sp.]|uniref:ATP-dependent DNA helicase n=1 Tax=Nocardioides sp. TaxID=35761 RepID=UPI002724FF5F|nr:ATP-dependent DNA helicase [Nocardioides sp.]MDO9456095.1 ATP-dependent DNA helicase [Nocardioides sp.]